MPSNSRPNDKSQNPKRNKRNQPTAPHHKTKSRLGQHTRDDDCKPCQCLGNKVKFTACTFYAANARETHYAYTPTCVQCSNRPYSELYLPIWAKQIALLAAAPEDLLAPTLYVPDGDCPGVHRRTAPRTTRRCVRRRWRFPRRPTDEGAPLQRIRRPFKKPTTAKKPPNAKTRKTTHKRT